MSVQDYAIGIIFWGAIALIVFLFIRKYKKTQYYQQTGNSFLSTLSDKGRLGEYKTSTFFNVFMGPKRELYNCYIPKPDGTTTEIDAIVIHSTGIHVFESKNYGGWIFGSEKQKMWTQTLPASGGTSQKNHFYNPVMQNAAHIRWLRSYLHDYKTGMFSYIVFSERCTFKSVDVNSTTCNVIRRNQLGAAIQHVVAGTEPCLDDAAIDTIYNKLKPLTNVSDEIKQKHIQDINKQ